MITSALALLALLSPTHDADDWPGWRGPGGTGVAAGSPPTSWSEGENVRWKVPIPGKGNSSPVVWGEHVFVTTAVPTAEPEEKPAEESAEEPGDARGAGGEGGEGGQDPPRGGREGRGGRRGFVGGRGGMRGVAPAEHEFVVLALNRKDGSVAWQRTAGKATPQQGTHGDGSYASPTLATNGEVVVASFGSNGVYAYTASGEPLWSKDLGELDIMRSFGEGSSPVLHGGVVLINWDHEGDSFLVALDAKTGEERWRVERDGGTSWTTPMVVEHDGRAQVIVGTSRTVAYDLESGEELWSYGQGGGRMGGVISSPAYGGGLLVMSTGGMRGELRAIRTEGAKGELDAEESVAWTHGGDTPHVSSPLVYDGFVYSLKGNSGLLSAYDLATGERKYGPTRMEGVANAYASPVAADGRLYFADRDGTVEVVKAGAEFETLAVNTLEGKFDASPAVAGKELYLRGASHLYCIAEGEK